MCVLAQCSILWLITSLLEREASTKRIVELCLVDIQWIFLLYLAGWKKCFPKVSRKAEGKFAFQVTPHLVLAALRPPEPGNEVVRTESSHDASVLGRNLGTPSFRMFIIICVAWGSHSEPTFSWWSIGWTMSDIIWEHLSSSLTGFSFSGGLHDTKSACCVCPVPLCWLPLTLEFYMLHK